MRTGSSARPSSTPPWPLRTARATSRSSILPSISPATSRPSDGIGDQQRTVTLTGRIRAAYRLGGMSEPAIRTRRWTRDEYDRLVELGVLKEDDPIELVA